MKNTDRNFKPLDKSIKEKLRQLANSANSKIDLNKVRDDCKKDTAWNDFYNECELDIISTIFDNEENMNNKLESDGYANTCSDKREQQK